METKNKIKAYEACEAYKAFWLTQAVKSNIPIEIARPLADNIATAWQAGYLFAKNKITINETSNTN